MMMAELGEVMKIGDILTILIEEVEGYEPNTFYFNEDLLEKQILIRESLEWTDKNTYDTRLELFYLSSTDACVYQLYAGNAVNQIFIYGIVNTVYELFKKHPSTEEFLKVMDHLSEAYTSASMQSRDEHRLRIHNSVKKVFENLKKATNL